MSMQVILAIFRMSGKDFSGIYSSAEGLNQVSRRDLKEETRAVDCLYIRSVEEGRVDDSKICNFLLTNAGFVNQGFVTNATLVSLKNKNFFVTFSTF